MQHVDFIYIRSRGDENIGRRDAMKATCIFLSEPPDGFESTATYLGGQQERGCGGEASEGGIELGAVSLVPQELQLHDGANSNETSFARRPKIILRVRWSDTELRPDCRVGD